MLATDRLERQIIAELSRQIGRRLNSNELSNLSVMVFLEQCADDPNTVAQTLLRIALKASPDAKNAAEVLDAYREITRSRATREMPALVDWVAACEHRSLPLPVVISCEKYLGNAAQVAHDLTDRYFGIRPIIVTGGDELGFDAAGSILRLPVGDVYEALPHKMFETWVFLEALGARHGVIKIDDDLRIIAEETRDIDAIRAAFADVDYMGLILSSPFYDRAWHEGKCASVVAPLYDKPFVAPWARGALYFLSKTALAALAAHYLRFPGCLAGELFEDKAVGDVLHGLGFTAIHNPLEAILGVSTDAPERLIGAAA